MGNECKLIAHSYAEPGVEVANWLIFSELLNLVLLNELSDICVGSEKIHGFYVLNGGR